MNPNCPTEIHSFTTNWLAYNQGNLSPNAEAAWITNQEKGYFGFLPNRQIKHLIIGSFPIWESVHNNPPHDSFEFAFFYCSNANGFYKIMETLTGYDFFQEVQSIVDFFLENQLGITDVIWKVKRTDANCQSASDQDLNPLVFNNLCQLLSDYSNIKHVYFTSKKVEDWYKKSLKNCSLTRSIHTSLLFSPSPASNTAAAGILNRDIDSYGHENSIQFHLLQIPLLENVTGTMRLKISKWGKRFRNVPGLVRPEILEHPNFLAIEDRL